MNNKMAINTYCPQLNLKNKLSKQEEQRQNHGYTERFDGCQMGRGCWGMFEEMRGLRSTEQGSIGQLQNSHGEVKQSIGNGVAEELILCGPWT